MFDLMNLCAFNAAYVDSIDSDRLEAWPAFFTQTCLYKVTNVENVREGLAAGSVYADSSDMLTDRVAALREANIYESQSYRHIVGIPLVVERAAAAARTRTPFLVVRIMATGQTEVFASGCYHDRFVEVAGELKLAERVVVCDSIVTDTLMALPL